MKYQEVIENLSQSLLKHFDEVYRDAEIIVNDEGIKMPVINKKSEWIYLGPSDQKESLYIRRNGEDEVMDELKFSSCSKSYRMRSNLRIVFFNDNIAYPNEILSKLMQSVLIGGTKLKSIIRDKWKLNKDESTGNYSFNPMTAYFAVDIYALWDLATDTCEEDFCQDIINPLKKELCPVAV